MGQSIQVYGIDDELKTIELGENDSFSKFHCKRCGCVLVVYNGNPHNILCCPNCNMYPPTYSTDYSDEEQIKEIDKNIHNLLHELMFQNNLLNVVKEYNHVREHNLKIKPNKE